MGAQESSIHDTAITKIYASDNDAAIAPSSGNNNNPILFNIRVKYSSFEGRVNFWRSSPVKGNIIHSSKNKSTPKKKSTGSPVYLALRSGR